MGSNANLWVLDFLLEADGLDDTLIKHFHDVNASQFEELPPNTQARLMLRVLRDAPSQSTGVAETALGALNMLKNLPDQVENWAQHFVPGANLDALKPSSALFTAVKTELILKSMREGNQGEHPKVLLDTFFKPPEQAGGSALDPIEQDRRNEILEGLKGPEEAQQLLVKFPVEHLNHSLLAFVTEARAALGPNMLKVVEKDVIEGRYVPFQHSQPAQDGKGRGRTAAAKRKRASKGTTTTEEDAAGMLANMSQSNAVLEAAGGEDPLSASVQAAQAADGKPVPGQEGVEIGEGGVRLQQTQAGLGQPLSPVSPQGITTKPQPRRKNGRWSEDETNFLIRMVRERGKGKWKRILEEGGEIFQNRSQVDLKDKWRNLERQGVVGPHDLPPQQLPHLPGGMQLMQIGMPQHIQQPQIGPDGQILPLLGADGNPFTTEHAQHHYAQIAAHYAQLAAAGQQLPPDLLQQQMGQHIQLQPHMAAQQMQAHMGQPQVQVGQEQGEGPHHHVDESAQQVMHPEHQQAAMHSEAHVQAPVIKPEGEVALQQEGLAEAPAEGQ